MHASIRRALSRPSSPARTARGLRAAAFAAALVAATSAASAGPVMTVSQLNVYRDGTSADWLLGNRRWLGDGFDNGNPLLGPAFSGTGLAASYQLLGLDAGADPALAARETGSTLQLDPSLGAVSVNALGQPGRSVRLRLVTDTSDPTLGLTQTRSFAASIRLPLDSLPIAGQSFGLRLTDGFSNSNDYVELAVNGTANGAQVVLRKQDFQLGSISVIGWAPLMPAPGASQLVLSLAHGTPNSNLIAGSFNFADASGALLSPSFASLGSAAAFDGELHTRLELRATAPVPEPASALMLAIGGLVLVARRRR